MKEKLILITLSFIFIISGCTAFPYGGCSGDSCFPQEEFSESYKNCGVIDRSISKNEIISVEIKDCIWNSYVKCQSAFAKQNIYGIEGQTGVSIYVIVEKMSDDKCIMKTHTNSDGNILNEQICNDNVNRSYFKENCERGRTIYNECFHDWVTCSTNCPPDYFISDGPGGSCQNLFL